MIYWDILLACYFCFFGYHALLHVQPGLRSDGIKRWYFHLLLSISFRYFFVCV